MAKQTLNTIKSWFRTAFKPTQAQFWDTWDSFFHKDDKIPIGSIEGLNARFDDKADKDFVTGSIGAINQKLFAAPIVITGTDEYTIVWDEGMKSIFGPYGDFRVWQNGSLEQVPIRFTVGDDGKPSEYHFTLSEIDTLIFIK